FVVTGIKWCGTRRAAARPLSDSMSAKFSLQWRYNGRAACREGAMMSPAPSSFVLLAGMLMAGFAAAGPAPQPPYSQPTRPPPPRPPYPKPTALPNPYRLVEEWPPLPKNMNGGRGGEVTRVHVHSDGNVWIFHRCFNPVPAAPPASVGGRPPRRSCSSIPPAG